MNLSPLHVLFGSLIANALAGCTAESGTEDSGSPAVPFALTSTAFATGETIPLVHECGAPFNDGPGSNETPPLSWTPGPEGTASYVVVMRDRDFRPAGYEQGLIHWAIYDIPANVTALPAGIPEGADVSDPSGAKQAEAQGTGWFGYFGPCSLASVNTYRFTVYALPDATLPVAGDASEINVADLASANALDSASLRGES